MWKRLSEAPSRFKIQHVHRVGSLLHLDRRRGARCGGARGVGIRRRSPHHPGQGTANRRFFFDNAMLELLWVHDEAGSAPLHRLQLLERWQGREAGASPFGLIFRPVGATAQALPFPGWTYQPSYLPEGVSMHIGFRRRRRTCLCLHERCEKARDQPEGFRLVSALRIISPTAYPSEILEAVEHAGAVQFLKGEDHLMEINFEGERNGRVHDFRPGLPLRVRW